MAGPPNDHFLQFVQFEVPCLVFFRHLDDFRLGLSAERIAKETLLCMEKHNIDVSLFKSHSLRGASATAMLAAGVPQNVTRQRGGWVDHRAFEKHYARLHQVVDWEACLNLQRPLFLGEYTVPLTVHRD